MKLCAVALIVFLAGCDVAPVATPSPVATAPPILSVLTPRPVPAASFQGGMGLTNTDTFSLLSGSYTARAVATDSSGDCTLAIDLQSPSDPDYLQTVFQATTPSGQITTNNLYNIVAGRYYLSVHTSCSAWAITLTPQP